MLFEAPLDGRPADEAVADDDILWMPVPPGSVQYGASYSAEAAGDLLVDPELWQQMVNQQYRLLSAVDRWIEHLERAHEDRTAAGIKAGETVRERADQALIASIGRQDRAGRGGTGMDRAGDDATFAVCRTVAEAAGITLTEPPKGAAANDRITPVERIAVSSRIRTRAVRLQGSWWRTDTGPWWATVPSPVPPWRCCGAAAATRRSTRPPGCGCASARTTPTNSNRAPSCSTARCRSGP